MFDVSPWGEGMTRTALLVAASVALPALAVPQELAAKRPDLEIVLLNDGGWTQDGMHYFMLKVGFSGEVEGGGDLNPGLPPPPRRLSAAAHDEIATLLKRERFFALPNSNLGCVPDLGGRSIEAWQGTIQRRVSFCSEKEGLPLPEIQAVLRVWYGVLSVVANGKPVRVADTDRRLLARKP